MRAHFVVLWSEFFRIFTFWIVQEMAEGIAELGGKVDEDEKEEKEGEDEKEKKDEEETEGKGTSKMAKPKTRWLIIIH